jgi:hypothetical protein
VSVATDTNPTSSSRPDGTDTNHATKVGNDTNDAIGETTVGTYTNDAIDATDETTVGTNTNGKPWCDHSYDWYEYEWKPWYEYEWNDATTVMIGETTVGTNTNDTNDATTPGYPSQVAAAALRGTAIDTSTKDTGGQIQDTTSINDAVGGTDTSGGTYHYTSGGTHRGHMTDTATHDYMDMFNVGLQRLELERKEWHQNFWSKMDDLD